MRDDDGGGGGERVILHLDLDCFYAQVEHERLNIPHDQPLAVQQWGSLLAVNYAARPFGVVRSEHISETRKKCPNIHLPHVETLGEGSDVAPNRAKQKAILRRYRVASRQVFLVIAKRVPLNEKASIDEAYMDVTEEAINRLESGTSDGLSYGNTHIIGVESSAFPVTRQEKLLCIGAQIAQEVRDDIQATLHFTTSVGVATNKLLSKLASPLHKPDGQTMIPPRSVQDFMQTFPVDKIRGLGGKLGVRIVGLSTKANKDTNRVTAGDIVDEFGIAGLQQHLGVESGLHVYHLCTGNDGNEPVNEKKALLAHLNSVKSFERTGLVKTLPLLHYWLRILCEEMVTRFEEEAEENQRVPTQLTVHFERPGQKKQFKHFPVPSKVTTEAFFFAALAQLEQATVLPCSLLYLVAKEFVPTAGAAATTKITDFFKGPSGAASDDAMTETHHHDPWRDEAMVAKKASKPAKASTIAHFFTKPSAATTTSDNSPDDAGGNDVTSVDDGGYYCPHCRTHVRTTAAEHEDYHMALALSSQWNDGDPAPKRPKKHVGPMDLFMRKM
ncbi:Aste57867_1314 [Aphanomyces stellatus]|uniref:Aste57867_1314 protein n=1 Tax=Aphanomyces stellatus TaxID=120398 RepID=A0A485KA06_9STRA|nr:hypothetical protein As57867_001313 [Aphanomyces stellatus]VFT78533.1 Aste57867_1314 [Aphanomyces stellatus]